MVLPFWAIPVLCVVSIVLLLVLVKAKTRRGSTTTKRVYSIYYLYVSRKGRWLIAIFALGAIIMLILFGILFICRLYWNQSMTFMVYGKGVCLLSRYLYCHLVHIWPVKIGDNQNVMKKCIYIGF